MTERGSVIPETEDDDRAERTMFISREQLFGATTTPDLISHYLVVLEGGAPGRRLEIDTAPITIGRGATQTLVCDDRDVSRQHARVSLVNGIVKAEDLGSTNGTFLESSKLTEPMPVQVGSTLRIGKTVFELRK